MIWTLYGVTAGTLVITLTRVVRSGNPFAPYGLPFAYTALSITVSTIVGLHVSLGDAFLSPDLITNRVVGVETLFILGLFAGVALTKDMHGSTADENERQPRRLSLAIGLACIVAAALYRLGILATRGTRSWNVNHGSSLSLASQFEVLASLLPLIGVCLLLVGENRRLSTVISRPSLGWLAAWAAASLLIGTRDEIIAPAIVLAWAYHERVKRLSLMRLTAAGVLGFMALASIGVWRRGDGADLGATSIVRPIASGVNTTAHVVSQVPGFADYAHGETYVAALHYILPFSTVSLGDPSSLTATLRLPSLIGYSGASGLGLSPVAEAYWNFGVWGAFLVPLLVGGAFAWSFRHASPWPRSALGLVYPVMVARTPIAVRSDFLQQYKGVLVVIVAVALVTVVERALTKDRERGRGNTDESVMRPLLARTGRRV